MPADPRSGVLTRFASGISGLLGLRGDNLSPNTLNPELVGTIEMLPFFSAGFSERVTSTAQNAANGNQTFAADLTVPPGEMWYLSEYGIVSTSDATGVATLTPALHLISGEPVAIGAPLAIVVSSTQLMGMDRPHFLLPGDQLGFNCRGLTATISVHANARFVRMRL